MTLSLDLLAALAILLMLSGLVACTYLAVRLLARLAPPRPSWRRRGALLTLATLAYLTLVLWDTPSLIASLTTQTGNATLPSVVRTGLFGTWLWLMSGALRMLARGTLRDRLYWRDTP